MKPIIWRHLIIIYFCFLVLLAPWHLLSFDTYYYWDWSRHLALSYYDGAPMIAYLIWLFTWLMGDTLLALNMLGIVIMALTSGILYKTARLFLSKEASFIAMMLWLFSPLATIDILNQTTYDSPLILFWALTLYFVVRLIQFNQTKDLYFSGISIGLMLLSKYSGVVLLIPLLIFLTTKNHRHFFKNYHFYSTLLISILLFSPVILWNAEHHWLSFLYQLTTHHLKDTASPIFNIIKSWINHFIPALNFMLLPPIVCGLQKIGCFCFKEQCENLKQQDIFSLCLLISFSFLAFYLMTAAHVEVRISWLTPFLLTSALLGGYCFQAFFARKITLGVIILYAVSSLFILINNTFPIVLPKKFIYYHLMQNLNKIYPQLPKTVLTSGWLEARMLFFLKNKPDIYTIACGSPQNQYALWSKDLVQKIKHKTIKEILYIDTEYRVNCVAQYFDQCTQMYVPSFIHKGNNYSINVFRCTNA